MAIRTVCVHQIDCDSFQGLPEWRVIASTFSRDELREAIGTLRPDALVLDLDQPDAMDVAVEAREMLPTMGIVGVVGHTDPQLIIAALRAGCRQMTTKPIDPHDLEAALCRALNEVPSQENVGQIVGVIGAQGGAGATTVACYLAAALAEVTKSRSLIIDCDFDFGNVARSWDLAPKHTIADVATAGAVDAHVLQNATAEIKGGVFVLARPQSIDAGHTIDESAMSQIVRAAGQAFPHTVLDLPRRLDAVTGAAIEICDPLLIVLQLTVPALDNARRLMEVLMNAGMPPERVELVVNRYRKNVHMLSPEMVEKQLKKPLFGLVPNDYKSVASAIDIGQPMAARSPVRVAISEIAGRLAGSPHAGPNMPAGGWLEKLGLRRRQAEPASA